MKNTRPNISNIIFVLLLSTLWIIFFIFIIQNHYIFNDINNRSSYQIKKPTIKDFLNGDYQEQLEQAISDQLPKYNYFQLTYPMVSNSITYSTLKALHLNNQDAYINLGNINIFHNYFVYSPITENDLKDYEDDIYKINQIKEKTNANIYLYYINSDSNINFQTNEMIDMDQYFQKKLVLENDHIKTFPLKNFKDYQTYFYQYDHHWNHAGANIAYLELVDMLHLDNPLKVKNTTCFDHKQLSGSKSKSVALNHFLTEKICIHSYDYPNFKIKINNEEVQEYGSSIETLKTIKELSYALIYGGDYQEILFENPQNTTNKNLLIYSNSYSNSINKLLASHYKNTYVIDGRYFQDFNMITYLKEKEIDDVLILGNNMLFKDTIKWGDF